MVRLDDGSGRPQQDGPAQGADAGAALSVVLAARNAAATLQQQLDALAGQSPQLDWELVVADNGSTDETVAIALAAAGRVPRLRVVDASAVPGAGAARNVGASAARGRYLAFCDADDVVAPDWVAVVHRALTRDRFVAGTFEGELLNSPSVLRSRHLPQQQGLQVSERYPGLTHAGAGNMGIRAEVFRLVGGFDESAPCLEDTDLCWRVQRAGVPLVFVPDLVVHVRLRAGLRSHVRQGYQYGAGERWLAARHGDGGRADAPDADRPGSGSRAGVAESPSRLRRRLGALRSVCTDLLRARRAGEVAAAFWTVAWGIGFATGTAPEPPPAEIMTRG